MSLNYQVYLVPPTPPATELETTTAPVLLVQGENPNVLAGTIVSAIEDSRRYVFFRQFACSVPNLVSGSAFIAHAGLGEMCRGRRCIDSRRGIPFFELEEIEHGQPIVVKARAALNFAASLGELIELPLRPPDTLESLATLQGISGRIRNLLKSSSPLGGTEHSLGKRKRQLHVSLHGLQPQVGGSEDAYTRERSHCMKIFQTGSLGSDSSLHHGVNWLTCVGLCSFYCETNTGEFRT
jgi:hypothetical protein